MEQQTLPLELNFQGVSIKDTFAEAFRMRYVRLVVTAHDEHWLDAAVRVALAQRAGWLCDSFFTARVAADLAGTTSVEKNFLENFLLPPSFAAGCSGSNAMLTVSVATLTL